eukprot:TRINITY_DN176_c1_g4_i1.p1 TRINITY_DN176_c1_g4~~TRINITY_DN176_c1_g4_i1.p1  ORF type:complete len:212 (-),score=80.45 TRINITY_DN176_c1_g4_i1:315-950(-)
MSNLSIQELKTKVENSYLDSSLIENLEQIIINSKEYSIELCTALLKLYQVYPKRINTDIIIATISKALAASPFPDFALVYAILPSYLKLSEVFQKFVELNFFLETGRFEIFWQKANAFSTVIFDFHDSFSSGIRKFITKMISITYSKINVDEMIQYLNINKEQLEILIKQNGWQISDSLITLSPQNIQENNSTKKIEEVEQLEKLLTLALQ